MEEEGRGYGCCEIIAYSLNIKAWRSASSCSADGGRGGIARRAYAYAYTHTHARICDHVYTCLIYIYVYARERKGGRGQRYGGGEGGRYREKRFKGSAEGTREWKKEGGQVTPPRAAVAAGEITAPSLLARDVHKLCITPSGAHVNYARPPRALYVCARSTGRGRSRERSDAQTALPPRSRKKRRRLSLERVTRVRIPVMTVKARDRLKGDIPFQRWASDSRSRSFA